MATHPSMKSRLSTVIIQPHPLLTLPLSPTLLSPQLPRFFSAFSLHFLHRPCYPKHVTLLRSLYISLHTLTFCSVICPYSTCNPGPCYMSQMKSLYTFTLWPFTVEVYWVSLNWPIHQCALLYVCFLLLSCAKVGITENTLSSVWGCQIL